MKVAGEMERLGAGGVEGREERSEGDGVVVVELFKNHCVDHFEISILFVFFLCFCPNFDNVFFFLYFFNINILNYYFNILKKY